MSLHPYLITLTFAITLSSTVAFSQCPSGYVDLRTQSDVNDFAAQYPNCQTISGTLDIAGRLFNNDDNIVDLSPLANLTTIEDDLRIGNVRFLTSLYGLHNLQTLSGDLEIYESDGLIDITALSGIQSIDRLSIQNSDRLQTLDGINNLGAMSSVLLYNNDGLKTIMTSDAPIQFIPGLLEIRGCDSLENLAGIGNLQTIGDMIISDNPRLTSLTGLHSVDSIANIIILERNGALADLSGLSSLRVVEGSFNIRTMNGLVNFNGLSSLKKISFQLFVTSSDGLVDCAGLESLESLIALNISYCDGIETLSGLENANNAGIFHQVTLRNNPNLSFCSVQSICTAFPTSQGTQIFQNADGCRSYDEVSDGCITLPLEWMSVSSLAGNAKDQSVLRWETHQDDDNITGFQVELASDAGEWFSYDWVAVTSNERSQRFEHTLTEAGWKYFRVVAVATDGSQTFSPVRRVNYPVIIETAVYPNPCRDQVYIEVNENESCQLELYNLAGQLIKEQLLSNGNGNLTLSSVAPGTYVLRVKHGNQSENVLLEVVK